MTNNNLEEYDPEYDFCIGSKYFDEPNGCNRPNGTCDSYEWFIETYSYLTEIEDKIESGELCNRKETAREILDEVGRHCGGKWLVDLYKKYGLLEDEE